MDNLRTDGEVPRYPLHHELFHSFCYTTSCIFQFVPYTLQSLRVPLFHTCLMRLYQQCLVMAQGNPGGTS